MDQFGINNKQMQGLLQQDPWLQYIPMPRILDLIIQVLGQDQENKKSTTSSIENVLPYLCFAMPPVAQNCTKLLNTLSRYSTVWSKLEEGLSKGKHLPLELVALLYEKCPSALEIEMLRILSKYTEKVYDREQCKELVEKFKGKQFDLEFQTYAADLMKDNGGHHSSNSNFWSESMVTQAAATSSSVFNSCYHILCKICIDTKFSISVIVTCQDFFAELKCHLNGELYEMFEGSLQHIVYLLTIPVTSNDMLHHAIGIEECLQHMLKEGTESSLVQCLLCFFPQWISVLDKRDFFNQYLRHCECFL